MASENKIAWCFKKGDVGLIQPNENISNSFIKLSTETLKAAENVIMNKMFLWGTVMAYYAEYYAVSSILYRLGIKSENHDCSIEVFGFLFGEDDFMKINKAKKMRIDSQYYMKVADDREVEKLLADAKSFVADQSVILNSLSRDKTKELINKIKGAIESA